MSYQTLYRKYRSQTFSDLIGQDHVVRTLQNGIASGRIAHSYLFTGPRGTGKTSTARLLAKALCCENGPTSEPDNTCEICSAITLGNCVDVIEMDAASESGVDDIREQIVDVVEYRPMMCRYKVFIIDEVHDLSNKAFDALLKTVEEPPPHIIFILATTEFNKVPPTIRSRCQKFEFHRATLQELIGRLNYVLEQERVTAEPAAISAIARMADGGYRDALTLLEQAMLTSEDGIITLQQVYDQLGLVSEELVDALLIGMKNADIPAIMEKLAEVARMGRDPRSVLESMMYRLQDLTRASYQLGIDSPDSIAEAALHETAARVGRDTILNLRGDIAEAHKIIRDISLPRLWLEAELVRLAVRPAPRPEPATPRKQDPPVGAPRTEVTRTERQKPAPEPAKATPRPLQPEATSGEGEGAGVAQNTNGADPWLKIVAEIAGSSRNLGMKLNDTRVSEQDGSRLVVEFSKATFYEWVKEKKGAIPFIVEKVKAHFGDQYEVEFTLSKEERVMPEQGAVELPAEGARLEQLARDVFGA